MQRRFKDVVLALGLMLCLGFGLPAWAEASASPWYDVWVFGVDSVDRSFDSARTDGIMLVSIHQETGAVKVTSFARDIWVEGVEGYGNNRINAFYNWRGPEEMVQLLNTLFGVDTDRYVILNFQSLIRVVNRVGGIDMALTSEEIGMLNETLTDNVKTSADTDLVTLNGEQALVFARVRRFDNALMRDSRQRSLFGELAKKVLNESSQSEMILVVNDVWGYIKTNESRGWVVNTMGDLRGKAGKIEQFAVPKAGQYSYGNEDGMSVLKLKWEECLSDLHAFLDH